MTSASLAEVLALALDAKAVALDAMDRADRAIERCERNEAATDRLTSIITRCTNEVLDVKRVAGEHHAETMQAFAGAKAADEQRAATDRQLAATDERHAQTLAVLQSKLTTIDMVKVVLASGGGSVLVTILLGALSLLSGRPLPPPAQPQPYAPTTVFVTPPAPGATAP